MRENEIGTLIVDLRAVHSHQDLGPGLPRRYMS
jgi:hypothetical protein